MGTRTADVILAPMFFTGVVGLATWLLAMTATSFADEPAPAERFYTPRPVSIDELKKFIGEQKGKVLIIDLWSDSCTICKEEFPRLVKLHEKHAKEGLVAASLCLDRPTNEKAMKSARQFLKEQKAQFANFVINEEPAVWQERLGVDGPPVVFVFGRDGKLVQKYHPIDNDEGNTIYDKLEKLLPDLLKAKP